MSKLETDLKALCELAKKSGATKAASFDAKKVVVDERVRLKCQVPVCDDYGRNLMCPPNVMGIQEFRNALAKYAHAILIQLEARMPTDVKKEIRIADNVAAVYKSDKFQVSYKKYFTPAKLKLHRIVNKVESQAFAFGYRFAVGFIAGSCRLCAECAVVNSEPCRHPFLSRPSMEAMSIDALRTAENAGLPFHIPLKDKIVWNGLVLVT
jgi:predicted metal-binding protein